MPGRRYFNDGGKGILGKLEKLLGVSDSEHSSLSYLEHLIGKKRGVEVALNTALFSAEVEKNIKRCYLLHIEEHRMRIPYNRR
jgi:hypothetical protein